MTCGYFEFQDINTGRLYKNLWLRATKPKIFIVKSKDLIANVLNKDSNSRYGIEGIRSHPGIINSKRPYSGILVSYT